MQKIILYYKFVSLTDPKAIKLWQKSLGERFNLRGRVLISDQGINGTLGGEIEDLKAYVKSTKSYAPFRNTVFKWSAGGRDDFPRLSVKVRPEIVSFGVPNEIRVDDSGVIGGGQHLKPTELHKLVEERGDEVVFFDGRNAYEAEVGRFKDALVADVQNTRDFIQELTSDKYNDIKDKPVVTYCTGGIRCEILSVLMKNRGFQEVYQLDGGIAKYGEKYKDDGLWEGALYVFDDRVTTKFSDKAQDIGSCAHCGYKSSRFTNCANTQCNAHFVVCDPCNNKQYCPSCLSKQLNLAKSSEY